MKNSRCVCNICGDEIVVVLHHRSEDAVRRDYSLVNGMSLYFVGPLGAPQKIMKPGQDAEADIHICWPCFRGIQSLHVCDTPAPESPAWGGKP